MAGGSGARTGGGATSSPVVAATKEEKKQEQKAPEKAADKPAETPPEPTDIYHVVGPGSVMRSIKTGKRATTVSVPPGELLELTAAEAKELGSLVALGEPPPPPPKVAERKAGRYRIVGPGSVVVSTGDAAHRFATPGDIVDLTEEDARNLGATVTEA